MATVTIDLNCNLQQAVQVQYLNGNMFSADNAGNTINVHVMDGEEPATLGGTVSASVIRADGTTVAVTGALEGNRAYVILPQACYAVPGVISIVIKNTQSSTVTTIAALVANVYQSSTDVVVDPGTIIPSVQNLIAAIDAAISSIPADYSSLWTSLAPAFSTSTAYTVGQYVTYNGGLYRFVADHAAGTWNSAHVVAANMGNDLSALKSALDAITESVDIILTGTVTSSKTINYLGEIIDSTSAYYVKSFDVSAGDSLLVDGCASNYGYLYIFTDTNNDVVGKSEQNGSGMKNYSGVETVAPAGAIKIVVASHTSSSYTQAGVTKSELMVTDVAELSERVDALESIIDDDPAYPSVNVTEKTNYYISGSVGNTPTENSHENWRILSADVVPGQKYRVSADYYSAIYGVYFIDENNKIVEIDGSSDTDAVHTIDVTAPATAVKISINDKKSNGFALKKIVYPIDNDRIIIGDSNIEDLLGGFADKVGVLAGSNQYLVGTGKMKTIVKLYGSQNGTVMYGNIEYDGTTFKGADDDVAPINTDAGYVGANHGYYMIYNATLSNHGLTNSDIGKTCTIDGESWVLIQVTSASTFVVGCLDNGSVYGLKSVTTPPTSFNFGTSITVTSISRAQLRPSVKNIKIAITKNNSEVFEISESYDIIALGDGIEYLIDHVGSNTNTTYLEQSDPAFTIRNLYSFGPSGSCVITQNYKTLNANVTLYAYGGTQSGSFGNSDYFAVPMTSYDSLSASGTDTSFPRTSWDDETKPPIIYCQADNSANSSGKMMVQGILMGGRNALINTSAGFIYTTRKMYPYAIQPSAAASVNTTYDFVSFRLPIHAGDMSEEFKFCQYCTVGHDYYFFCFSEGAASDSIHVPVEFCGKKIETVMAKNATCHNTLIVDSIDVTATDESYLLLKITD